MAEKNEKRYVSDNAQLMAEWDWNKNSILGFDPTKLTCGSHKKVWWLGKCGHEWEAQINSRDSGRGCPICAGKLIIDGINDLSSKYPEIALEWHPTKNEALSPDKIAPKSNKSVWWMCCRGHEWKAKIEDRANGAGCPYCSHRRVAQRETDLATVNPKLAEEWHPTKNDTLSPSNVSQYSSKVVWWLGKCGHEWQASIGNRANGTGCPICWSESASSFPEQTIFFYCRQVTEALSRHILYGKEIDIFLPKYSIGIEYNGYYHRDRTRDLEKVRFFKANNIRIISIYGDNANSQNKITEDTIEYIYSAADSKNLTWAITKMFELIDIAPPIIDIETDRISIMEQYIQTKKENSIANRYPKIAQEWHPFKNGQLTPNMFDFSSHRKVWWLGNCGHEWQATIQSRTQGRGCPVCAGKIIISGENDLLTLFPKTAQEWHPTKNAPITPQKVSGNSHKKVWWYGSCGHEWQAQIKSRTHGAGCPICSGAIVLAGYNDLATTNPQLTKEWHPIKNQGLSVASVSSGSEKKVWWVGTCGHEWQAIIKNRARGAGCPICARERRKKAK